MNNANFDFSLRLATIDDARDIFNWRNDPTSRSMSLNSDEIDWELHLYWYTKSVNSSDEIFLIGNSQGKKIGVVRYSVIDIDHVAVSINLNPNFRGLGLGRQLLTSGSDWLRINFSNVKFINAVIKSENIASINTFISSGYSEVNTNYDNSVKSFELKL